MQYAYIRVSSKDQKIDRQLYELKPYQIQNSRIYIDKESGKDFNRPNYLKLIKKLKKGDLLIIKSIDRLGRNYDMILEEWKRITKKIEADIYVIDMPLLNTKVDEQNLMGKFISDIVLQILSFVSENERMLIKRRQAEGIRIAKEKGVKFGRPKKILPENTNIILNKYERHEISSKDATRIIGISKSLFFKLIKQKRKSITK